MESRRLYRSEQDRMLGGVCGGLGAHLGVDPTLVRVVFVVLAFFSVGVVLYLVMWVIVPSESALGKPAPEVAREGMSDIGERAREGARQAREAIGRIRGGRSAGGLVPEPRPVTDTPPQPQPPPRVPEPQPLGSEPGEDAAAAEPEDRGPATG